mgnify:CR=1 FL=1
MTRELIGFALVTLVLVVAFRVIRATANKREQQEATLPEPLASAGGVELGPALYVSTVLSNSPLTRIWAYGLGSRGKAQVYSSDAGLSIERRGERDILIPASSLRGITRESATIDKGVERDGLVAIHWTLGNKAVTTHLRVVENAKEFISELSRMTGEQLG